MSETPVAERQQVTLQQQITISVLLSPTEAAKVLHTTPGVLAVWRSCRRYCLRYVKVGRKILYRAEDIQAFIEARTKNGVHEQTYSCARRSREAQ